MNELINVKMQSLTENELYDINGGLAWFVVAGIIVGIVFVVSVVIAAYNEYKAAEKEDQKTVSQAVYV